MIGKDNPSTPIRESVSSLQTDKGSHRAINFGVASQARWWSARRGQPWHRGSL